MYFLNFQVRQFQRPNSVAIKDIVAFKHKVILKINSFQELHLHFLMTNNNKLEFEKYKLGYGQKLKSNNEDKISQFSPSNFYFTVRKLVHTNVQ